MKTHRIIAIPRTEILIQKEIGDATVKLLWELGISAVISEPVDLFSGIKQMKRPRRKRGR